MYNEEIKNLEEKMKGVIEATNREFTSIRTGRANPSILDRVLVDYYGTPTPIAQCATIAVPEPRMMTITPWDKAMLSKIEKTISNSDIGLVPANDGNMIRLAIPHLTEERRKELVKVAKKSAEDMRVAARNIRRDANEAVKVLEKDKMITEDDLKRAQDEIQKATDKYIAEIDKLLAAKEAEIMQV
jgi:ribosome recycling factor